MNLNLIICLICLVLILCSQCDIVKAANLPLIKDGDSVAFMGDSITAMGSSTPGGYVRRAESGLAANDIKIKVYPTGVGGHKSNDMLARLHRDVIVHNPDWLTLSCGVNDVVMGERGVSLTDYKRNITALVEQALEAGIKIMILTPTPIQEEENEFNRKLAKYVEFLHELAVEKNILIADLNAAFWQEIKQPTFPKTAGGTFLTYDGIHMNPLGDVIMAREILKTFGLSAEQLDTAFNSWLNQPAASELSIRLKVSLKHYLALANLAAQSDNAISDITQEVIINALTNAQLTELQKAADSATKLHYSMVTANFWWWTNPEITNKPTLTMDYTKEIRPLLDRPIVKDFNWQPIPGDATWIDGVALTGHADRGIIYAETIVTAPANITTNLRLVSDFYTNVYINDELAAALTASDPHNPREAILFEVKLQKGENRIQIRHHSGSLGNGFSLGFRDDNKVLTYKMP